MARFADQQLLVLLLLSYVAATFWPTAGRAIRNSTVLPVPIPLLLLALLLLLAGLGIDSGQLRAALQRRWLILAGQVAMWGVPLTAVLLLARMPAALPPGLLAGLGLVAMMPTAASSVAWSQLGRGNIAISVGLLATSTLLSPLIIAGVGRFDITMTGGELSATANSTAARLIGWIIPAVLAGGIVRWWAGSDRIATLRPHTRLLSTAVLLVLNYANAALALPQVFTDPSWMVLASIAAATASICGCGFLTGWLFTKIASVEPSMRCAFVFGIGMKNTGMALVICGLWLEGRPLATLAIVLYTLMQHLLAAAYHRQILASGGVSVIGPGGPFQP